MWREMGKCLQEEPRISTGCWESQSVKGCTSCTTATSSSKYASWFFLLVTAWQKRRLHSKGQGFTNRKAQNSCLFSSVHAEIAAVLSHCPHEVMPEFSQFFWSSVILSGCFRLASFFLCCLGLRFPACKFLHWWNRDCKNPSLRANTLPSYYPQFNVKSSCSS